MEIANFMKKITNIKYETEIQNKIGNCEEKWKITEEIRRIKEKCIKGNSCKMLISG